MGYIGKGAYIHDVCVRSGWGRGCLKSRRKEQNQLICDNDIGDLKEGVIKSKNFADIIYGIPK